MQYIHLGEFHKIFERRFLNLFHEHRNEHRNVNGINFIMEKASSATFECHDLDTTDGLPVFYGHLLCYHC